MKKTFIIIMVIVLVMGVEWSELLAQCPMCRMSAESNLKGGGTAGKGLNAGILYMLSMPYLLVFSIGYIWWRNRRHQNEDESHMWN